jgi:poly(beta-D-mannuronate) lyase
VLSSGFGPGWRVCGQPSGRGLHASNAAELAAAFRRAQPGDAIVMANGEWRNADVLFAAEGSAEAPITLRAATPGKVLFTGVSRMRIAGRHLVVEGLVWHDGGASEDVVQFRAGPTHLASHCRLTRCAIVDYNPPDKKTGTKWISLYGFHNRVDHCFFAGKTNTGATLVVWLSNQPNYHRIDHNHFGRRPALGVNGGETIRIGTSDWSLHTSRSVVEFNYFEHCGGEIEIISSKSCENIFRYNTFLNCEGALTLRHGNRCLVEGNFFFGNHRPLTGGVRVIGEDHRVVNNYFEALAGDGSRSALTLMNGIPNSPLSGYFQVKRVVVAFNTFVDCHSTFLIGRVTTDPPGGVLPPQGGAIANNIVASGDAPFPQVVTAPIGMRWEGNLLHGAAAGTPGLSGIRLADPELVRAGDGLFRPGPSSPALGAAEGDYPWVEEDIDGHRRRGRKDIGCDQASGEPVRRRPLNWRDVGPDYLTRGGPAMAPDEPPAELRSAGATETSRPLSHPPPCATLYFHSTSGRQNGGTRPS